MSVREILAPQRFAGIEVTQLEHAFTAMPWGFSFQLAPTHEETRCLASFDARIHDPAKVRAFVDAYKRLLADLCGEPGRPLRSLLPAPPGRFSRLLRRAPSL